MSADRSSGWAAALARIERQLEAYRACLIGEALPEPLELPPGLGPIPAHLADHARDLLERYRGMEAALEARRTRIGAALARSGSGRAALPPAYIDARI